MPQTVTIFSAVPLEAKAIASGLSAPTPRPTSPAQSTFHNLQVIHHLIGIRAIALPKLTINPAMRYIILAGVAGALDPSLAIGDLILGDCPQVLAQAIPIRRGSIHTSEKVVASPADKTKLYDKIRASIVDMETAIVRDFAAARGITFISLRAVSDLASQSLDPSLLTLVDAWGRPRPMAVARFIAGNPLRARALIQLGRDSTLAARRLGEGVQTILRQIGHFCEF